MGRTTLMLKTDIHDEDEGENPIKPSEIFLKELEKKYGGEFRGQPYITDFCWRFTDCGEVIFVDQFNPNKDFYFLSTTKIEIMGEVDNHIKMLLEVVKKYDHKISGTFAYDDDQSGGSCKGIVYIAKDCSAMVTEFDTDVSLNNLDEVPKPEIRIIKI